MHHLGVGKAHARKRVLAIADDTHVTVCDLTTAEVLSVHLIQPDKTYWRNQKHRARPMAELLNGETYDATHQGHMSRLITRWS
jgi:hypothetical protein